MIEGFIEIDANGVMHVPETIASRLGFTAGATIPFEMSEHSVLLHRSLEQLNRVYVEITNFCNLNCTTCIRNVWSEKIGFMKIEMFRGIIKSLLSLSFKPEIFIGGFGEPTTHPDLLTMIHEVKTAGFPFHLITNGTKLTEPLIQKLIEEKVDQIWISIDSVYEECYGSIRDGASFDSVNANIRLLDNIKTQQKSEFPKIGIAYVAMKDTIAQLPEIAAFAKKTHAEKLMVTNVLAHTEDMATQRLYENLMHESGYAKMKIIMPRLDLKNPAVAMAVSGVSRVAYQNFLGQFNSLQYDSCPFILKGSVSIRWDGQVSPCLPLLHMSSSYLSKVKRTNDAFTVGSLVNEQLLDIWNSEDYVALRKKLKEFNFSPCTTCYHDSCEVVKDNQADCFGNKAPACGGCQWAQGFIQCP